MSSPQTIDRNAGNGETILVVDDEELVLMFLVDVLSDLNYKVLDAHDARTALQFIERKDQPIDLILSDFALPLMNGRELAKRARELRPGIKVLFMTGYSRESLTGKEALPEGTDMLQKPVAQTAMAAKIRAMLAG